MWVWMIATAAVSADDGLDEDLDIPVIHRERASEEGFGLDDDGELEIGSEEDPGMTDFVAEQRRKAPPPTWFHVDPTRGRPLGDNYEIQVVSFSDAYVVVQLPVLIAADRASFVVAHPHGLVVAAEIESGPHKLVQRQEFSAAGVLLDSPTLAFFEVALPVSARSGSVRFLVKTAEALPPPDPKQRGVMPAPLLQDRFARTTVFTRP